LAESNKWYKLITPTPAGMCRLKLKTKKMKDDERLYGLKSADPLIMKIALGVCEYFETRFLEIIQKTKKREIVEMRQIFHFFIVEKMVNVKVKKITLGEIGYLTGGHDHATILHSVKTIKNLSETNADFREKIIRIREYIKAASAPLSLLASVKVLRNSGYDISLRAHKNNYSIYFQNDKIIGSCGQRFDMPQTINELKSLLSFVEIKDKEPVNN
jgi:hypothetical protein